ncbi:MAG TPA: glucosamine-6-phosphate deaminase [Cyclobacteriaceae bacterium]|nr:glucosamine-6-phosphate deaminase [Cyclobacteriaceae bacterium]
MKIKVYPTSELQSKAAAQIIADQIRTKPDTAVCLATGDSPFGTYRELVRMVKDSHIDCSRLRVFGLDEWVGIPPDNTGSCHHYLHENFIGPLGIGHDQVHLFDGLSKDLSGECSRMTEAIRHAGGIDIMIVGIGMNGHIGFNEPGVDVNLWAHAIELDEITKTVGQKYFQSATPLSKGITQGFQQVFAARTLMLLAHGKKKASIIHQTAEAPIGIAIPSTLLRQHKNSLIMLDEEAAGELAPSLRN